MILPYIAKTVYVLIFLTTGLVCGGGVGGVSEHIAMLPVQVKV